MKEFVNKLRFTEDQRSLVIPIELGQAIFLGDKRGIRILCDAFHHQIISPSDRDYLKTLKNPSEKSWYWGCDHNGNDQEWEDVKDTMSPMNNVPEYQKEFEDFLKEDRDKRIRGYVNKYHRGLSVDVSMEKKPRGSINLERAKKNGEL